MTQPLSRILLSLTLVLAILLPSQAVRAAEETPAAAPAAAEKADGPIKVVVVDVRQLMAASAAAQSVEKQIAEKRKALQAEFGKIEKGLREEEQTLVKQQKELSPEEFAKKRRSFEEKLISARKSAQSKRESLERGVGKAADTLRKEILEIVAAMAKDRGYDLVVSRDQVVIVRDRYDITAEVMKLLNARLKTVKVEAVAAKK